MYGLRRWMWATVFAAVAAAPAAAQQPTTTTPTTLPSGSGSVTSGGRTTPSLSSSLGSSGLGGRGSSGLGSGGSGLGGNGSNTLASDLLTVFQPQNLQYTNLGTTASSALQKSNVFSQFYANPYAMGMSSSGGGTGGGGGFGQPLFGTSTGGQSGGGRNASFNSATSGLGAGGFGGGGRGGFGGQNNAANQSGILIPVQVQMNYAATLQFPTVPAAAGRIQTDIRAALDGTSMIANSKAVEIITDRNNNVTLRGPVADEDEARLIEGMVRLTPGVREIKNELVPAIRNSGR